MDGWLGIGLVGVGWLAGGLFVSVCLLQQLATSADPYRSSPTHPPNRSLNCSPQAGGKVLDAPAVEITYGLERILMARQGVKHFKDIK